MKNTKLKALVACGLLGACSMIMNGCPTPSAPLSAARSIAGTWTSLVPTNVHYLTNCSSNSMYTYKTWPCKFTFVITAVDDNDVTVDIYGDSYSTASDDCGESPPIASGFPVTFSGVVSSSALTLEYGYGNNNSVGQFAFTTNLLAGAVLWVSTYDGLGDAIGWSTDQINLTKQ